MQFTFDHDLESPALNAIRIGNKRTIFATEWRNDANPSLLNIAALLILFKQRSREGGTLLLGCPEAGNLIKSAWKFINNALNSDLGWRHAVCHDLVHVLDLKIKPPQASITNIGIASIRFIKNVQTFTIDDEQLFLDSHAGTKQWWRTFTSPSLADQALANLVAEVENAANRCVSGDADLSANAKHLEGLLAQVLPDYKSVEDATTVDGIRLEAAIAGVHGLLTAHRRRNWFGLDESNLHHALRCLALRSASKECLTPVLRIAWEGHFVRGEHNRCAEYLDYMISSNVGTQDGQAIAYTELCCALSSVLTNLPGQHDANRLNNARKLCSRTTEEKEHRGLRNHGLMAHIYTAFTSAISRSGVADDANVERDLQEAYNVAAELDARDTPDPGMDELGKHRGIVMAYDAHMRQFVGDPEACKRCAESVISSTRTKHPWHPAMKILIGWCDIVTGTRTSESGLADIENGLRECVAINHWIGMPFRRGLHADALRRAGRKDEALQLVEQQIEACKSGERLWLPPLETLRDALADPTVAKKPPQGFRGCFVR